jgi:hypothetical protein
MPEEKHYSHASASAAIATTRAKKLGLSLLAPVVEDVKRIGSSRVCGGKVIDSADDCSGSHAARRVVVSPNHKNSWVMTSGEQYQVM